MQFIKDLLFPKTCVGCGAIGSFICNRCQKLLLILEKQRCFYCKSPSLYGFTHPGCKKKFGVDGAVSIYVYNPFIKKLLKTAKYRLAKEALDELLILSIPATGGLLYSNRSPFKDFSIASIPLHSSRLRARGFNQADVICAFLKSLRPTVKIKEVLLRTRNTPAQAQMKSKLERYKNMLSVFETIKTPISEKLLLVDDVITTGATVRSATEALKRSGVSRVYAFSLARG